MIRATDVTEQNEPARLSTFASDIGLRPGEWPETLKTELGNGCDFLFLARWIDDEGELIGGVYRQLFGNLRLTVFND